jgi:hypothetical protein
MAPVGMRLRRASVSGVLAKVSPVSLPNPGRILRVPGASRLQDVLRVRMIRLLLAAGVDPGVTGITGITGAYSDIQAGAPLGPAKPNPSSLRRSQANPRRRFKGLDPSAIAEAGVDAVERWAKGDRNDCKLGFASYGDSWSPHAGRAYPRARQDADSPAGSRRTRPEGVFGLVAIRIEQQAPRQEVASNAIRPFFGTRFPQHMDQPKGVYPHSGVTAALAEQTWGLSIAA